MAENQRRQKRLGVALAMRVRGVDRYGLPIEVTTSSEDVSRGGCSFQISHEVKMGAELELEILRPSSGRRPPAPFLTMGIVLRVSTAYSDQFIISVQFTGPQFPTYSSETTTSE